MLHPSYNDLIQKVNSMVEEGEEPLVESRYSIVIAAAKRARQIIGGQNVTAKSGKKPLSLAVEEMNDGKLQLSREGETPEEVLFVAEEKYSGITEEVTEEPEVVEEVSEEE